jgi:precorrin-2/cobalt-factor-2 C20-methyltransferase
MVRDQTVWWSDRMTGTLYGIGVGPGDPELLTLKALRCIEAADVIAYPVLENAPSFARSIVEDYITDAHEEFPISLPMLVDPAPAQKAYDAAADEIAKRLKSGQVVTVLCEGDPFFYGSFQFLFTRLAPQHRVEIVPGVSSLMSCAVSVETPLSARNDILTVLPAPLPNAVLQARLETTDCAAIIKIGRHFERIRALLHELNLEDHCRYVERSTLPSQRVLRLADVDADKVPYFSMILMHKHGEAPQ